MYPDDTSAGGSDSGRQALLVLGMHRSGTSACTRVLSLLGFDLPGGLMPPAPENARGFWEPQALANLQDQVLDAAGSTWADWRRIPDEWFASPDGLAFTERLADFLRGEFAAARRLVLKDPRTCRLIPLWRRALAELNIEPLVVVPVRNPLEVAASLQKRNGFDVHFSQLLWLRHVLDVERETRGLPRSFVSYDGLLNDWRSAVMRVARELGIDWPVSTDEAAAEIEAFLSPEERHHLAQTSLELVPWARSVYDALLAETGSAAARWTARDWDRMGSEFDRASAAMAPLTSFYERQLAALRAQAQAEGALLRSELESCRERMAADATTLAELRTTTKTLSRENAALGGELAELRAGMETLSGENATLGAEVAELRASMETLTGENATLRGSLSELQAAKEMADLDLQRLEQDLSRASEQLNALLHSTSWKITAPARALSAKLRRG